MPASNTDSGSRAVQKPKTKVKVKRAKPVPMGSSPSGDRPQGREQAMAKTVSHRQAPVDPNTGRTISTLRTPPAPRGAQQRGTSPSGDRPQGRASEMRAAPTVARVKKGKGPGGPLLAVVHLPKSYVSAITNSEVTPGGLDIAGNAVKDAAELAVTTPSSVAKIASTAATHPKKLPGMLAQPYKDLAHDPVGFVSEHPVSTALMLAPAARMPGRIIGKGARIAGKQTLERPAASLPGTAMKDPRTGSRDALVRAVQSRADKKDPTPTMTVKDVQRRVDEHFDQGKHLAGRAEKVAVREARKTVKDLPKEQRKQAAPHVVEHARETAREQAHTDADARFAQEFGATGRPSTGAAERDAARTVRVAAVSHVQAAKAAHVAAKAEHAQAFTRARIAVAKAAKSPTLKGLETRRRNAQAAVVAEQRAQHAARTAHSQKVATGRVAAAKGARSPRLDALEAHRVKVARNLAAAQRTHADAMAGFGVARGRAEVLSRNVAGAVGERKAQAATVPAGTPQYAGGSHGVKLAAGDMQGATGNVERLRSSLQRVDQAIKDERKRLRGMPSKQRRAVIRAAATRDAMPDRVRTARDAVRAIDRDIAAEQARIKGVPPEEHTALIRAIDTRAQTRTELAGARAAAEGARATHIAVKQAMRTAHVTDHAPEGRLFEHQADARLVAQRLNETETPISTGGKSPVRLVVHEPGSAKRPVGIARSRNTEPLVFTVRQVGDKYAVVPKVARDRMYPSGEPGAKLSHQSVGTSPSTMAKVMRRSRAAFTGAVLPFSLKWLGGQGAEAGLRSLVAGAGPFDWFRTGKVVKKMNALEPGSGDEWMMRITGGQFEMTAAARDFAAGKSLAEEFKGTALNQPAAAATAAGHVLPVRAVRAGFRGYSRAVIGSVNGAIEHNARRAMAGQAIKNSPLIENRMLGLMDGAITDAANGLRGTPGQITTARAADRMYGKYSKQSPEMRSLLMHWTPFLPWFINSAYFLAVHLPKDHPVQTALLADISMATEDWRKSHDLSLRQANHVPLWMMGGYPKPGGGYYNLGHYFPTGAAAQIASSTGGLVLPQMIGPIENLKGIDWKGKRLVDSHGNEFTQGQDALRALVTAGEGQIPGAKQAGALTGLTPRYVDKTDPAKIPGAKAVLKKMLPTAPIGGAAAPVSSGAPSGRVKIPGGVTGRVKVPGGVTGRVKIPGG